MQDKDIFNFFKAIFSGLDYSTDFQYNQAIQQVMQNPWISPDYKNYIIQRINNEYNLKKEQLKNGKDATDFLENIYKIVESYNSENNKK